MLVYLLTLTFNMEDIQNKFKIINELSNNLSVLHKNNNNFNDKSKKSFEIKLKLVLKI